MRRVAWRWLLPVLQLAFALAAHIYKPHEYRVRARARHVTSNLEYFFQNSPALSGRFSQGINFPAMVLDYPLRSRQHAMYEYIDEDTLIFLISGSDIGFFFGIVIFWHWVGRMIDSRLGTRAATTWSRPARIAGLACGFVFGVLTAAYAGEMIASEYRPLRQIGAFGIVWAAVFVAYFGWRLAKEFSKPVAASKSSAQ
jgi:hypothetical protein